MQGGSKKDEEGPCRAMGERREGTSIQACLEEKNLKGVSTLIETNEPSDSPTGSRGNKGRV